MTQYLARVLPMAIEFHEASLWRVGPFELAMLIAGGIITMGMIVAFVVVLTRKDDAGGGDHDVH